MLGLVPALFVNHSDYLFMLWAAQRRVKGLKQQVTELHRLREECAQLRDEMSASRKALKASIQLLQESLALRTEDPQLFSRRRTADALTFAPKRKVN
jgi:hypothetical protein